MPPKTKKKSTVKSQPRTTLWLNATTKFPLPKGLIRKGNFLVWQQHPFLLKKNQDSLIILHPGVRVAKGWTAPRPGSAREKLALLSPASFLVYELVWLDKYKVWKVLPKFPISTRKNTLDRRGLNAAWIRAVQFQQKYGKGLMQLIQKLQHIAN